LPTHKTTQVKRYSSVAPFVSQKHSRKGKSKGKKNGFKKSPHFAALRVVFFLAALAAIAATLTVALQLTPLLHSNSLHYAPLGTHSGRVGLFFLPSVHSVVICDCSHPLKWRASNNRPSCV
jgi:hypothetical protein